MQLPLFKAIQKVPGGLMVVPFFLGVLINSFIPGALNIGGMTTALFRQGAPVLIAMFMVCMGSQINFRQASQPIIRGTVLTLSKFLIGALIGWGVGTLWGPVGVLSLTPLAVISSLTNNNGGMYVALAGQYGDSSDVGAVSILAVTDGPFLTMLAFGVTGMANIPFVALLSSLIPLLVGFILGNLDEDFRKFFAGSFFLIPFFAFPLGAALDIRTVIGAGGPGVLLGLFCTVVTGLACYFATRIYSKKLSVVGAAVGTTAGNAVATPATLALADPSLEPLVASATAQVAAAVVVTAILCPLLVSFLHKRQQKKGDGDSSASSA
ncbi:MAG: 2-keto-3-deoxygluconate permease [Oscillospiraceae bacterium]|nr:2-keto-3-deoxygluconate permease [Oscillospiraceae bacterium]